MEKDQLIKSFPNLISDSTSLYFYKQNELLSIDEQEALFKTVCKQISELYPGVKMLIESAGYKFQRVQITFVDDPEPDVLQTLSQNTDAQYFTRS
jgi:uncharacterized protein involved in tolerance to divalent cations